MYIYNNNTFIIYSQPPARAFRSHHIRSAFGKFNFMFDGAAQTITADMAATQLFVAAGYSASRTENSNQLLARPVADHQNLFPTVYFTHCSCQSRVCQAKCGHILAYFAQINRIREKFVCGGMCGGLSTKYLQLFVASWGKRILLAPLASVTSWLSRMDYKQSVQVNGDLCLSIFR